jgi:hypothetical protein
MTQATASTQTRDDASRGERRTTAARASSDRQEKAAVLVFVAFVVVGGLAILGWLGDYFWFHGDEWDFLVERDGGNLSDLLEPHNEHLTPLPIIVYRILWNLFGLRSYLPYQIPVVTLHLTAAVLLRAVMRRCEVNPWIATAAASVFVLFGPGEENIIWAFQIGFTGSLVFSLAQLLLADHPGKTLGRRDWLALGAGVLGLLCHGLTPILAAMVGAVVLVRRGLVPAAFQTVPILTAYAVWWIAIGPDVIPDPYGRGFDPVEILQFVKTGLVATFVALGGNAVVGGGFALVLVAGLALSWVGFPRGERLRGTVMPLSLAIAGIAFLLTSGYGRWWVGPRVGSSSRYVHLTAAFMLPALAVAIDALVRRWRLAVAVAVAVLVSVIPQNVAEFETNGPFRAPYYASRRELIAALARSDYVSQVPRGTMPDVGSSNVTAGWLIDTRKAGDLPVPENPASVNNPTFRLRYGLSVIDAPPAGTRCEEIREPVDVFLEKGDELGVKVGPSSEPKSGWFQQQGYTVQLLDEGKPVGSARFLHPSFGALLRAELDDLEVRFGLASGTEAFIMCR